MAIVVAFIKDEKKRKPRVRFRLYEGHNVDLFYLSKIEVDFDKWDKKKECVKSRISINPFEKDEINNNVENHKELIKQAYETMLKEGLNINSKVLKEIMLTLLYPKTNKETDIANKNNFYTYFDKFVEGKELSKSRNFLYLQLKRTLLRFEKFYDLDFNIKSFNTQLLYDFQRFMENEHNLYLQNIELYKNEICKYTEPKSINTITGRLTALKTFFNWTLKKDLINKSPFIGFVMPKEVYGTPYYLTIEERNNIYNFDLSKNIRLKLSRDIFIFQCCIGCRISDLWNMTNKNIINGAVEYIANKTKNENPLTVRVPLNSIAQKILNEYKEDDENAKILPFPSQVKYNKNIKTIFKKADINRLVTIFNSTTKKYEQKPLYEIASSHLARRTFIGNLYKQVKDPNLIGSLSGHVEGSKAFARYRTIDEDMKKELVKLLE